MADRKIAILDFTMYRLHSNFNTAFANEICKSFETYAVTSQKSGNYKEYPVLDKKVRLINVPCPYDKPYKTGFKLSRDLIRFQWQQWCEVKKLRLDAIFILNFSVVHFALAPMIYNSGVPIYVLLHDVDELNNRRVYKLFQTKHLLSCYVDKLNFVVLEQFEKEELVSVHGIDEKKVFVLPWVPEKAAPTPTKKTGEKVFISLSNSNDEGFVEAVVEHEKATGALKAGKVKYIIKSKKHIFDDGALVTYNRFLPAEEYSDLYDSALAVVTPFPPSFRIRVSGTTLDAFNSRKHVIGSDIPIMKIYEERYPSLCSTYHSVKDLFSLLLEKQTFEVTDADFNKFKKDHSSEKYAELVNKLVTAIKGEVK